jgi:hypothetical protein
MQADIPGFFTVSSVAFVFVSPIAGAFVAPVVFSVVAVVFSVVAIVFWLSANYDVIKVQQTYGM